MNPRVLEDLFGMRGQVALITGAADGLGREIARAYAIQGAAVVLSDKNAAQCEAAAEDLRERGHEAIALRADVGDALDVARLATASLEWRGRVDVLVCNAGVSGPTGPLADADDDMWQQVFDINLRGAARLATLLIPPMANRRRGSVVLLSSIAGLRGNKSIGLYGLSKAALAQLARNLAVEWGPHGVRVNAISPGLIRTGFSEQLMRNPSFLQRRLEMTPLRRVGEAHEVAGVAVMLASNAGGFITGQNLVVDGGTLISDGN